MYKKSDTAPFSCFDLPGIVGKEMAGHRCLKTVMAGVMPPYGNHFWISEKIVYLE
jgi:hypothetical protein